MSLLIGDLLVIILIMSVFLFVFLYFLKWLGL